MKTNNINDEAEIARLRAYLDAGHVLANNTHTHPWLRDTKVESYLADIDQAQDVLSNLQLVSAPYFRFPYLDEGSNRDKRLAVVEGLESRGLQNGYVTVDTYDWYMQALLEEALASDQDIDTNCLSKVHVDVLMEGIAFYDDLAH
ncbi:polysaccharide deacetylase family protein [Yoonia sp. R2-816]|uniref:polysaccharide deacetylase family protein n=1 Tax=Yoonia sp. R2-816 TaxID=3342638 RepID=UPI00372A591D